MNLEKINSIYFIGIGGIGMSALARYFRLNGRKISGYDRTPSSLTDELIKEGIEIHFEESIDLIPKQIDLVVYTPAIPIDHSELKYYREHNYSVVKRSDLLEALTQNMFTIAVAGTHGKTTTSSMIAHILKYTGYDCTAFLGGVTANYHTNFLDGKSNTVVVEADEYDRSFLKLHPDIAVVTSCDADHLDIYGTREEVEKAYGEFTSKIKPNGLLITKPDLPFLNYSDVRNKLLYSVSEKTTFGANGVSLINGAYAFNFLFEKAILGQVHLKVGGYYNVENAIAAGAVAYELKIEPKKITEALSTFMGVKRRFEYIVRNNKVVYIDDYAHHPAEIAAFLKSVREIFPTKKIICVFQPHLYTRTRDFADGFASSLSGVDQLILLPIYPARELPIAGVDSQMLLDNVHIQNKRVTEKKNLLSELETMKPEVLVTVGAGDIDQFVEPIKYLLETSQIFKS